jgi:hypothetical protein
MTFKQAKATCLLFFLAFTFTWSQYTPFYSQKTALENSYHEKVVSTLSRLINRENFIVIVNVEFSNGKNINKTSNKEIKNGYAPIPGLPTVPSQNNTNPRRKNNKTSENNSQISKITINIELNEKIASEEIEENIKSLINKALPEIKECEDCIIIDTIQFLPTKKSTLENKLEELQITVAALQSENEFYENEKRKAKLAETEKNFEEIQKKLSEALAAEEIKYEQIQKQLSELEKKEDERIIIEQEKRDAELLILQEEKKFRTEQLIKEKEDSEKKVQRMMNSKIRSDSLIISEAMDMYKSVMKQKGGSDFDNEALLGMQIGNSGPGMMNAIIFLILILFIIMLLFFTLNKKNKTIYLKPKIKKKSSKKDGKIINEQETINEQINHTEEMKDKSTYQQDDDSIRSEFKTLKQTAVSLTVGEKENATNLIKDWLDDNPNKANDSEQS